MKNHNNNRKRTASGRRSKWWAHFEEEADAQNQKFACCKYCNAKYKKMELATWVQLYQTIRLFSLNIEYLYLYV